MPFSTSTIGTQTESVLHTTDPRWLMAYAASLGDTNPLYMDTTQEIYAHPVFPVCLEWPSIQATRQLAGPGGLTDSEASKGVHATHDLHIYRTIRPYETLRTHARVIDVQEIRPGAACVMQIDTLDSEDQLVCRTYQTSIYRGGECKKPRPGQTGRSRSALTSASLWLRGRQRNVHSRGCAAGPYLYRMRSHLESDSHRPRGCPCRRSTRHHFAWHRDTRIGGERLGRWPVRRGCWQGVPSGWPIRRHGAHAQRY